MLKLDVSGHGENLTFYSIPTNNENYHFRGCDARKLSIQENKKHCKKHPNITNIGFRVF